MSERAVMIVIDERTGKAKNLDIPLDISLYDLLRALHEVYDIHSDVNIGKQHLSAENPTVLLKGNHILKEYGLREGSIIHITY